MTTPKHSLADIDGYDIRAEDGRWLWRGTRATCACGETFTGACKQVALDRHEEHATGTPCHRRAFAAIDAEGRLLRARLA